MCQYKPEEYVSVSGVDVPAVGIGTW